MLAYIKVEVLWKSSCGGRDNKFNVASYGKLFNCDKCCIITADEDGVVRIYEAPTLEFNSNKQQTVQDLKLRRTLETKSGPALHLLLRDVTRLSPCDMLVGDSHGTVVLFCDGQILQHRSTPSGKINKVTALEVHETAFGETQIIVGREDGELFAFNSFTQLWKLRLSDLHKGLKSQVSINCILAAPITTSSSSNNMEEDMIIVADSAGYLHIILGGKVRKTVQTKLQVRTMVTGRFLSCEDQSSNAKNLTQIALGCKDGCVHVCADLNFDTTMSLYADLGHPVTHLKAVQVNHSYLAGEEGDAVDLLICGGHFSVLKIFQHGKVVCKFVLPTWPTTIIGLNDWISRSKREGESLKQNDKRLLVACQDSSLQIVQVS